MRILWGFLSQRLSASIGERAGADYQRSIKQVARDKRGSDPDWKYITHLTTQYTRELPHKFHQFPGMK